MRTIAVVHPGNVEKQMLIDVTFYDPKYHVLWEDKDTVETVEIEVLPAKPAVTAKVMKSIYDPKTMKLVDQPKTRRKSVKLD